MNIGIVGTSTLTQTQEQVVDMICDGILGNWQIVTENPTLVSGGAEGVDTRAELSADRYGLPKLIFKPEVYQWEDGWKDSAHFVVAKGFMSRNTQIAQSSDVLYCINTGTQTRNFPARAFLMVEEVVEERVKENWGGGAWTAWCFDELQKKSGNKLKRTNRIVIA